MFLSEPDEVVLLNNAIERARAGELSQEMRTNGARMAALYGRWLCEEAKRRDLPMLDARPYATLASRIVAATSTP